MIDKGKGESPKLLKTKVGRPQRAVIYNQQITLACTLVEKKIIESQAYECQLTVSAYVRRSALGVKVIRPSQMIPKEVLSHTAALYQLAAALHAIARKRDSGEELNALERASLQYLSEQVKQIAQTIKSYLK